MTDLSQRLRGIDRLSPPDLWETVRAKAASGVDIPRRRPPIRRIATIATALLMGLASIALLVFVFRPAPSGPALSEDAVFFPTMQSGPSGMQALYEGTLIERDGCIFMDGGHQVSLPLWPNGYTVDRGPSDALQIRAEEGAIVAVVGEPISMGGGYVAEFFPPDRVEPRDIQIGRIEEQLGPIPPRCLGSDVYGMWAVGSIEVAESEGTPSTPPLMVRVWTTQDPFDLHISATYRDEEIELDAIETPGPDLEYPARNSVDLPVGTPIVIASSEGQVVSVFELAPARGEFVVEEGSCIVPGALQALPGPAQTAFFIYVDGNGYSGGQAFRSNTFGDLLNHDSAVDSTSGVDARQLGLAVCDSPPAG